MAYHIGPILDIFSSYDEPALGASEFFSISNLNPIILLSGSALEATGLCIQTHTFASTRMNCGMFHASFGCMFLKIIFLSLFTVTSSWATSTKGGAPNSKCIFYFTSLSGGSSVSESPHIKYLNLLRYLVVIKNILGVSELKNILNSDKPINPLEKVPQRVDSIVAFSFKTAFEKLLSSHRDKILDNWSVVKMEVQLIVDELQTHQSIREVAWVETESLSMPFLVSTIPVGFNDSAPHFITTMNSRPTAIGSNLVDIFVIDLESRTVRSFDTSLNNTVGRRYKQNGFFNFKDGNYIYAGDVTNIDTGQISNEFFNLRNLPGPPELKKLDRYGNYGYYHVYSSIAVPKPDGVRLVKLNVLGSAPILITESEITNPGKPEKILLTLPENEPGRELHLDIVDGHYIINYYLKSTKELLFYDATAGIFFPRVKIPKNGFSSNDEVQCTVYEDQGKFKTVFGDFGDLYIVDLQTGVQEEKFKSYVYLSRGRSNVTHFNDELYFYGALKNAVIVTSPKRKKDIEFKSPEISAPPVEIDYRGNKLLVWATQDTISYFSFSDETIATYKTKLQGISNIMPFEKEGNIEALVVHGSALSIIQLVGPLR